MPATLEAGTINGYCVGEPWNQQAVFKGIGVPVITDYEIWKNNPEKVFGVTAAFAEKNPNTRARADQGADPRRACGSTRTTTPTATKAVADALASGICRRRHGGHRQQHDRHLRIREGRQARDARTSTCSSATSRPIRTTPMPSGTSRRCGAGARSPKRKPDAWYRRDGEERVSPRPLSRRPPSCWSPRARRRRKTSPGTATAIRAPTTEFIDGVRLRRPQAQCLHRQPDDRSEGQAEGRGSQGHRWLTNGRLAATAPERRRSRLRDNTYGTRQRLRRRRCGRATEGAQERCSRASTRLRRISTFSALDGWCRWRASPPATTSSRSSRSCGRACVVPLARHRPVPGCCGPGLAPQVKTSLGAIPGPAAVWEQTESSLCRPRRRARQGRRPSTSARTSATPRGRRRRPSGQT